MPSMNTMNFQSTFKGETKEFTCSSTIVELRNKVKAVHRLSEVEKISYRDEDGDYVKLRTDQDLEDAGQIQPVHVKVSGNQNPFGEEDDATEEDAVLVERECTNDVKLAKGEEAETSSSPDARDELVANAINSERLRQLGVNVSAAQVVEIIVRDRIA